MLGKTLSISAKYTSKQLLSVRSYFPNSLIKNPELYLWMAEPQFHPNEKFYTMSNNLVISLPLSIWMLINNI